MKLKEFIEKQIESNCYSGLIERYYLARDFIYSFNGEYQDKKEKTLASAVPFYNLDNIDIQEIQPNEDMSFKRYKVILPNADQNLPKNETFNNCLFADYRSLRCKPTFKKEHDSSNGEISSMYKSNEEYVISTLSIILFYIYFGYHPMCGRDYYACVNVSSDYERSFFEKKHTFIFKSLDNSNRFVNGYHNGAWALWNVISDNQKAFWIDAFDGAFKSYADFFERWKSSYSDFTEATASTPCDIKLKTILFDEKYALITSDNTIGNKTIRCRECNNGLLEKCDNCQVPVANRNAGLFTLKVKLITQQTKDGKICNLEKEIELYSGKILYESDFSQSESQDAMFEVIASKKANVLGLRYLFNIPLEANCGSVTRFYKKGEAIALLPGAQINVIPDVCKIVVPGVPIEVTAPKAPDSASTKQIIAEKSNASQTVSAKADTVAEPTRKTVSDVSVTNKSEGDSSVNIANPVKSNVSVTEAIDADDENAVYTEDGNICDVLLDKPNSERQGYDIYTVKGRRQQKIYFLKLFDTPMDEQERRSQMETISGIRRILAQKVTFPLSLLYPKAIVLPKGFAKYRVGYIYNELPSAAKPISSIINDDVNPNFDKREIAALLDLFDSIKRLHSKGMLYNKVELKQLYMDIEGEKCYLVDNENISIGSQPLSRYYLRFTAPEIASGNGNPDELTDSYSFAIIAFMVLYKMHPYDKTSWRNKPDLSNNAIKLQYVYDPQFCFASEKMYFVDTLMSGSVAAPAHEKWRRTPNYIKDLFEKTFLPPCDPLHKDIRIIRNKRPGISSWCDGLNKWYNELKSQKR